MELFKKGNLYSDKIWNIEYNLKNHLQELKTENGKKKATDKANQAIEKITVKRTEVLNLAPLQNATIAVDWKRSYMWGNNPSASLECSNGQNWQHTSGTASGCGYDKLSAAVAEALNDNDIIMATIAKKVRTLNKTKKEQEFLVYGIRPQNLHFQGGVGIDCFRRIFETIGYNWQHVETNQSDFITITKKGR